MNITHALLKEASPSFFAATEIQDGNASVEQCGIQIANEFYAASDNKAARVPTTGFARRLLVNAFTALHSLVIRLATAEQADSELLRTATNLLAFLADQPPKDQPISLPWQPDEWRLEVVQAISSQHLLFDNVEAIVHCLLALQSAPLTPALSIDDPKTITAIIDCVGNYVSL